MDATALLDQAATDHERRTLLTLMAFAAGDAFGVAYEYTPEPLPVDTTAMRPREDWPFGGVSDDTLLSLLTIFAVEPGEPAASARVFIERLRQAAPELRGLGPTTRAALGLEVAPEHAGLLGVTNGGMMRTSLLGLAYASHRAAERRTMVAELTRATHREATAVACAVLCSALYARALETGTSESIGSILRAEGAVLVDLPSAVARRLEGFEEWTPPADGVPLDPVETLMAVAWVAGGASDLADAYRLSCELGGDTDTVAALAGGLVATRTPSTEALVEIPWIDDVLWAEIPELVTAASLLAEMRRVA